MSLVCACNVRAFCCYIPDGNTDIGLEYKSCRGWLYFNRFDGKCHVILMEAEVDCKFPLAEENIFFLHIPHCRMGLTHRCLRILPRMHVIQRKALMPAIPLISKWLHMLVRVYDRAFNELARNVLMAHTMKSYQGLLKDCMPEGVLNRAYCYYCRCVPVQSAFIFSAITSDPVLLLDSL